MPLILKGKRLLTLSLVPSREKRDYSSGCERTSEAIISTNFFKVLGRPLSFDWSEDDRGELLWGLLKFQEGRINSIKKAAAMRPLLLKLF